MKVLCVHSFAVHGTASLKAILGILGTRVLPVPSLYLSGLTNIDGFVKTEVEFEKLWLSSLALARSRKERLILYIGYLGCSSQAKIILDGIEAYQDILETIVVDPVSGDQGRIYVPDEVLEVWPDLLEKANWAFPNYTELQLFSRLKATANQAPKPYLQAFRERFPALSFVVTSLPQIPEQDSAQREVGVGLFHQNQKYLFQHTEVKAHYGGTGDVFVAYFIMHAFFEKYSFHEAMEKAALNTLRIIENSLHEGSPDLILHPKV